MTTAQLSPSPAQRLGRRLMPRRFDFLVFTLAGFWYLLANWSGATWLMVAAASVALIAGGLGQAFRHRRAGAVAHQRFGMNGRLGWGIAAIWLTAAVGTFTLGVVFDPQDWPAWVRGALAFALAFGLLMAGRGWLAARSQRIAEAPGPASSLGADLGQSPDDVLCDLLSRTQMMRVDTLSEDLMIPSEELGPRLESLMDAGVVGRRMKDDGPVDDHHWVHLTFRGEQQLAAALPGASTDSA